MEHSADNNGKMTIDRVAALSNFVRQADGPTGSAIRKQVAELGDPGKAIVSKRKAWELGMKILEETEKGGSASTNKIKELIAKGADVNAHVKDCLTPLMRASVTGNDEVVGLLIKNGAGVDLKDVDGDTALMMALRNDERAVVWTLLDMGANPDIQNGQGLTALMMASEAGNYEIALKLISSLADVNVKDPQGRIALDYAKTKDMKELLERAAKGR